MQAIMESFSVTALSANVAEVVCEDETAGYLVKIPVTGKYLVFDETWTLHDEEPRHNYMLSVHVLVRTYRDNHAI